MICAGIDIGSRSIELVLVENDKVIETRQTDTGFDPISQAKKVLAGVKFGQIMATGYGRNLFEVAFDDASTITEIKAHAAGVRVEFPEALAILDIGGQDSKSIRLNDQGRVVKFEMNDRCAAGTGKFLEIMAHNLGFSLDEFGPAALDAQKDLQINSMCTVFAESEVTSLIAKGQDRQEIARGLHLSVVKRAVGMLNRVGAQGAIVFSGGVAQNPCMVQMVSDALEKEILVPEQPQMMGALGAAMIMAAKR
ncbi:acyl-CoA dehydratase activase [uncultured Desulfobacter sp.]|uniref:acyl-CoA dehydratase activase n=1 Tax=uncultured Desulfobacter sp. TaxID=240139 RepID=UPI0029F5209A|nr:acyl-CoA dehydratase activase [uncultured Desulfobacter sp.]